MSLTGQTDIIHRNDFPELDARSFPVRSLPVRMAALPRWISRHRTAIEATATMTLAMSAPVLAAVATLQTSA
jgi:hypothetical protein